MGGHFSTICLRMLGRSLQVLCWTFLIPWSTGVPQDPWPSQWNRVEWQEIVLELKGEMKEMQEKLAAQEAIITEINRTNAESTQNTNPGTSAAGTTSLLLRNDLLPAIPEGESHFTSKLSI